MRLFVRLALMVCAAAALAGCGPKQQQDLTATVLFTASGSFDAQADLKDRVGGGIRRVQWTKRPPLNAGEITVRYDSDARTLAWIMEIRAPEFTAEALAGPGGEAVSTPQGAGTFVASGRLRDVLILSADTGLTLMTRGYAAQEEPTLLPAFGRVR
ncbi:hypothetical protein [Deinococcus sp. QL22]|uniref:hypothetical protein n=1 Tax=Deinococcus sp. QL22 TaxID=2939437 RepID=UPI002017E805|nr:hypothetical protein [Deinococcus sp. QL22]UQN06343.1 hypothetical protein M1R55_16010 [Deinococcus sp. QL22]